MRNRSNNNGCGKENKKDRNNSGRPYRRHIANSVQGVFTLIEKEENITIKSIINPMMPAVILKALDVLELRIAVSSFH